MLQTIQKIGPLLDLFTVDRPEWGVSEAADALGIPRSSAHALLTSLTETGLLASSGKGRYRLGWRIVELHSTMQATIDIRTYAEPTLRQLNEQTGETTNLGVLDRGSVIYLDKIAGRHQVSASGLRVGTRLEAHCSAMGQLLLAYASPTHLHAVLNAASLRRFTDRTITDPQVLAARLEEIRGAGWAYESGQVVADVSCIAAPVRDSFGVVVAAISITGPSFRVEPHMEELSRTVRGAANDISARVAAASTPLTKSG